MLTAEEVIARLGLVPLTLEGGYFRETYRSPMVIQAAALPDDYGGERNASTAIYYLLTPEAFSAIHRVRSDEVFHFYAGDPVEMLQLRPEGGSDVVVIGNDLEAGQVPQVVVPAGVWQGGRLAPAGPTVAKIACGWALLGCTVAPGFDYAGFEPGDRAELIDEYPKYTELITALAAR